MLLGVDVPDYMRAERIESITWNLFSALLVLFTLSMLALWAPFISWVMTTDSFSPLIVDNFFYYWQKVLKNPVQTHIEFEVGIFQRIIWYSWGVIPTAIMGLTIRQMNPHRSAFMLHGDASFGTVDTLRRMEKNQQIGRTGKYLHFGFFEKQKLALIETLSVLCLAPPGTGKTAGFVIPSIIESTHCCLLVNDPKPELWEATSGFRSSLGPSFKLEWSAVDNPAKNEFYPKFNFLDKRIVPKSTSERDTFIDAISKTLIPETTGDKYFVDKGRAALVGLVHLIYAKINDRTDPERYEGITDRFIGKEASIPMLVDFIVKSSEAANETKEGEKPDNDPLKAVMQSYADEAKQFNYPARCYNEISGLINMADKERSGVLGSLDQGLLPFKNEAVVERSSASDFSPEDLRGRLTPESVAAMGLEEYPSTREEWDVVRANPKKAVWEPVSVYVCINQAVASSFSNITALFFQTCSQTLLAYGPNQTTQRGTLLGPFPTCFMIDEFAKLPKIPAVLEGPDLGRSKSTFYILVAQDYGQIGKVYSKEDQGIINGTTAAKVVLAQTNPDSIDLLARMAGKTTVKRKTISRQVGFGKGAQVFGGNQSESQEGVLLLNNSNLGSMPPGKHLILSQGFMNRPIWVTTPMYFRIPELNKKVFNPRTLAGPKMASPMPKLNQDAMISKNSESQNYKENLAIEEEGWFELLRVPMNEQMWKEHT